MTSLGFEVALRCRACMIQSIRGGTGSRTFTSTSRSQKHGSLPTFPETSSPELDSILSTFRSKVFVPSHLLRRHKNLIYRPKMAATLTNDPVEVEIGTEHIQLEPINKLWDEPSLKKSFTRMLDLMAEPRDWRTLPDFLTGLHTAKRKFKSHSTVKMVRRANEAEMQSVVMECVRRVESTGFALQALPLVREVMLGAHLRAQQAGWEEEGTINALAQAEQIVEFMEDPRHRGEKRIAQKDPRVQPDILGIPLELAALRAVRYTGGKDEDGKVAMYAERVVKTWNNADFNVRSFEEGSWYDADDKLLTWAPVWMGLKMASKVLDSNSTLGKSVAKILKQTEQIIKDAKVVMETKAPHGRLQRKLPRGTGVYGSLATL